MMNVWSHKPPLGSQLDPEIAGELGLVACYLMNEVSGNKIYDLSGNGNHGLTSGGPLWKPGRDGVALAFDGSDDYGIISNHPNVTMGPGLTVIAWIFPLAGNTPIVDFSQSASYGVQALWLYEDQKFYTNMRSSTNVDHIVQSTGNVVALGQWNQITVTYDGNTVNAYVNAQIIKTANIGSVVLKVSDPLRIGGSQYGATFYGFNGLISSVSIYKKALSPSQILDLYINPYGMVVWQPKKWWLMPQGGMIPPQMIFGNKPPSPHLGGRQCY